VNKEALVGLIVCKSFLFMQSISIPSLVGNLVAFLVLSENQNVITNSLNRSNIARIKIVPLHMEVLLTIIPPCITVSSAWRDFNTNICYGVRLCHEASHEI
jgi:hypothetical protein